jgi:hypothetical protein
MILELLIRCMCAIVALHLQIIRDIISYQIPKHKPNVVAINNLPDPTGRIILAKENTYSFSSNRISPQGYGVALAVRLCIQPFPTK